MLKSIPVAVLQFWRSRSSLFLCVLLPFTQQAFGQAGTAFPRSVTLSWDPVISVPIAGYRVYQGTSSRSYTRILDAGNIPQATLSGLSSGITYYFAVTAYNSAGLESDFSAEVSYTPINYSHLAFAADSGLISLPFVVSNGILSQPLSTPLLTAGRAVYNFTVDKAGDYTISAQVNAPNGSQNSFYVNVDAEPADPQNIWNIPATSGFMSRTVNWSADGAVPHVFRLGAGNHQLIIRGRSANTQLSTITIAPVAAQVSLTPVAGGLMLLEGLGPISHSYYVQASTDLIHWTTIATITSDETGAFSFIDSNAGSVPAQFYRLRDRTISPGLVQLRINSLPSQAVQLRGTGVAGVTYEVQATSDLSTWTAIGNLTADSSGNLLFTDAQAPSFPQRYYRVRETTPVIMGSRADPPQTEQ